MPTYHVQCADRQTGEDYITRIPAADPSAAQKIALAKGHLVSAVVGEDAPAAALAPAQRRSTWANIVALLLLIVVIPAMLLVLLGLLARSSS